MLKLSDFVANFVSQQGIKHVFMLTGGGAMHLNNSFGKHPNLQVIYNHHEQASAMAAESYARLSEFPAVVNVTTGPGGINALNGVFGAWTDSIPMIIISGQVRLDTTIAATRLPLRQLGDQECDIIRMVGGITKYAVMVTDPYTIQFHLQKAFYLAMQGRKGPVWLDIPMNVQGAMIDENNLTHYVPEAQVIPDISVTTLEQTFNHLKNAARPVILAGSGIRHARAANDFLTLIDRLNIPVTTAWNAHDLVADDHPCYIGRPGTLGDRAGNFAVQNADVLLVLGCRLNIRQISYNWTSFARGAYKIIIDIDKLELLKPTLKPDLAIHADVGDFIRQFNLKLKLQPSSAQEAWLAWCKTRRVRYPVVLDSYWKLPDRVNPYCFMRTLSEQLEEGQIIVSGDGTACVTSFQSFVIKRAQRLYTNSGCASMGYDLPAAIGAHIASRQSIICLAGDGSIQQNIQELAVIAHHDYPIKIFVLNNEGYHSIRQTQENFFGKPFVGVGPESGLGFPNMEKVASAYGLPYVKCKNHAELKDKIHQTLAVSGAVICEVLLTLDQPFSPKLAARRLSDGRMISSPLEDLSPHLSREELAENMLIPVEETV